MRLVPEAFVKVMAPRLPPVEISSLVEDTEPNVFWPALDWSDPPIVTLPVLETTCKSARPETKFRYPLPNRLVELTDAKVDCPAFDWSVPPTVRLPVLETT